MRMRPRTWINARTSAAALLVVGLLSTAAHASQIPVLVLKPTGSDFSDDDRTTIAGLVAASIARRPAFSVSTEDVAKKGLNLEAQREALGACDDDSCLRDVAGLVKARLVVFGDVNKLGKLTVLNLTLFDSNAGKTVNRVAGEAHSVEELPSVLRVQTDALMAKVLDERRKFLLGNDHRTCPDGMVRIPAGQFFMGVDPGDDDTFMKNAQPSHHVKLDAFCIDRTEVTVDAYAACSSAGKCRRAVAQVFWPKITEEKKATYKKLCTGTDKSKGRHPVNCVSWAMADRYCKAQGARLPTEAEWEYATRGPDGRRYPWGDEAPTARDLNACGKECLAWSKKNGVKSQRALYKGDDGFALTAPVGSFPAGASRFGPVDVVGNVWEWTADWYGPYTNADKENPTGPESGTKRVIRGGAFNGAFTSWVRPAARYSAVPEQKSHAIGFRCARSLE